MMALSKIQSCANYVDRAAKEFANANESLQQSFARTLGVLDYTNEEIEHGVEKALDVLVGAIEAKVCNRSDEKAP